VLQVAGNDDPRADQDESGFDPNEDEQEPTSGDDTADAAETLSLALCVASSEGIGIGIAELMRITGMSRPTLYRYLAQHAQAGSAVQVGWGRWRSARCYLQYPQPFARTARSRRAQLTRRPVRVGAGEGRADTPARPSLYAAGMAVGMPCGICGPLRFGLVGDAWQGGWFLALAVPEMPA
jgi:predicted DNA-binding transcriptional regulator AlpA